MIKKILLANRGEIALRILRTCHELGIETVAVHSTADDNAMHVRLANESVCIGPPDPQSSYLNISRLISAAEITQADAIHPGYGFLSENYEFAKVIEDHGFTFIGPRSQHIKAMGDKIIAKRNAIEYGLPIVPGSELPPGTTDEQARKIAAKLEYPLIIKAAGGGGGRGMQIVKRDQDFITALNLCRNEAQSAFSNPEVYLERYLENPRHIEVQVVGDGNGKVWHFWERDCSIQRRHQKLIEEAPATILTSEQRNSICELTCQALAKMNYLGAGTVEYLYSDNNFYFIEMNTRIQVEHGVSELITGHDLIGHQILVAQGKELPYRQSDILLQGHAIQCRINAENAYTFMPSPGKVEQYHPAGGTGIRIDSALYSGVTIPPYYDSLIAKLMTHAEDRHHAIRRMDRALAEFVITGIDVNLLLLQQLMHDEDFCANRLSVNWLEGRLPELINAASEKN